MTHKRGERSRYALRRRIAIRVLTSHAHLDLEYHELVSTLTGQGYINLCRSLGASLNWSFSRVDQGEILIDSRGEGSLQRMISP